VASSNVFQIILKTTKKGSGAKDAEKELGGLQKAAKTGASALGGLAVAAGVVGAAVISAKKAFEFAAAGAQIQRLETAFNTLSSSMGQDAGNIEAAIKAASNNTVDSLTAMGIANRALILGVAQTPEQFTKLTAAATALGQAMGESASQAVDDLTTGIGRMSPLILDNLGIVGASINAYPQYAAAIGTTADKLTDAQKKQALLNYALEKAKPLLDANGNVVADNASAFERFGAQAEDAGNRFKKEFADLLTPFVNDMADALQSINEVGDAMDLLGAKSINYAGHQFYDLASGVRVSRQELLDMANTAVEAGKNIEGVEFHGITAGIQAVGDAAETAAVSVQDMTQATVGQHLLEDLNSQLAAGTITQDQYDSGFRQITKGFGLLSPAAANAALALRDIDNQVKAGNQSLSQAISKGKQLLTILHSLGVGGISDLYSPTRTTGGPQQQQATMKNFTVPPGFQNDSFGLALSSGEQVSVSRPGQTTYNTNHNGPGQVINIATQIDAEAVVSQLSKAARRA
jgi:hypothetical protein